MVQGDSTVIGPGRLAEGLDPHDDEPPRRTMRRQRVQCAQLPSVPPCCQMGVWAVSLCLVLAMLTTFHQSAHRNSPPLSPLLLWPPTTDLPHDRWISAAVKARLNVSRTADADPTLQPYLLAGGNPRPLVIVCPGGGYVARSAREASVVQFLNQQGFHAAVLHYRVQRRHPAPLLDARRAIQLVFPGR